MSDETPHWISGWLPAPVGFLPIVSTRLAFKDIWKGWLVRWDIGRMNYKINPGLYATGKPDVDSPVLVTANYKLSFDSLRKHLEGINAWILVLDTRGVNVWCSAGKGTFGTEELIKRLASVNVSSLVRHRVIILPQLAAPGVAAHLVTRSTGFKVVYGPVRASDIPDFLKNGLKADPKMRTVTFTLKERLAVIPIELVQSWKIALAAFGFHILVKLFSRDFMSWSTVFEFIPYIMAILIGAVLIPVMLPWIPGRSLAWKGWIVGVIATIAYNYSYGRRLRENIAYLLILPAISAFFALNFTGATTYTSLSGVKKEMRFAMPLIIFLAASGMAVHLFGIWRTTWAAL